MASGIVCQKCGTSEKMADGRCRQCHIEANRRYRKKHANKLAAQRRDNKEKIDTYNHAYYIRNSERLKAASAKRLSDRRDEINEAERKKYNPSEHWRKKNPGKHKEWVRRYVSDNSDLRRIYEQNRRARKKFLGGTIPLDAKDILMRLQRGKCACCRISLDRGFHIDHIKPLSLGGLHAMENLQLLCPSCNLSKQAKDPIDFMQSRGYLL